MTTVLRPLLNRATIHGLASMIDRHSLAIRMAINSDTLSEGALQGALSDLITAARELESQIVDSPAAWEEAK